MATPASSTPTTGTTPARSSASAVGPSDVLGGRYRILRDIGSGSSATVFEAVDQSLERRVAVKVLHRKLSTDPAFLERFRDEARKAAALGHPNVMAVHDWGEDEVPFLVMELLSGGSLRSMLDAGAMLTPSQTISVGLDACRGLQYAHGQGLVHRDVTPANLLFGEDSRLRIADFGLARALAESGWTEPGKDLVGTARYASPEQAKGLRLGGSSDVYSLGLILVEALSGSVPFSADTMLGTLTARVESDVPIPDVPNRLGEVLRSMTSRDPEARPTSTEAGVALLKAAEGLPRPKTLTLVGLPEIVVAKVASPGPAQRTGEEPSLDNTLHDAAPTVVDDPDATRLDLPDQTAVGGTPVVRVREDEPVRRWPWLLISVAAIAAAGWFIFNQLGAGVLSEVAVPNVAGMTSDEAVTELGSTWVLDKKFDRVVDVATGLVIRTEPEAGETLEEGQPLSYWISLGLPLVRVPESDLVGRSREQAVATIEAALLTVGEIDEVNNEDVGAGLVMTVEADALELPQGGAVNLVVSLGPSKRVIPEALPGTNTEQFIASLVEAGLGVEQTTSFDDEVPLGQFVSITPPPGTSVDRGDQVVVVISDGPFPVPVPNMVGFALGDALKELTDVGLLAGELAGSANARCEVAGTDPIAGTEIQPGNVVTIFLSECDEGE